jgi:hypothetical protein
MTAGRTPTPTTAPTTGPTRSLLPLSSSTVGDDVVVVAAGDVCSLVTPVRAATYRLIMTNNYRAD